MFFFFFNTGAAEAFKEALKAEGLTYGAFATRVGVNRATITKFVSGRPLSPALLKTLLHGLSDESHRKKLITGYLRDEMIRVGFDPSHLVILDQTPFTPLLAEVAKMLPDDPQRVVDLMKLLDAWKKGAKGADK